MTEVTKKLKRGDIVPIKSGQHKSFGRAIISHKIQVVPEGSAGAYMAVTDSTRSIRLESDEIGAAI